MSDPNEHLSCIDAVLKEAYTGGFSIPDPRKTRDPMCLEWKRLGGFTALRGEREWVECRVCHRLDGRPRARFATRTCECDHGESHEVAGPICPRCKGRGGWDGAYTVKPTRDPVVRKRLKTILAKAGESRLMVFESGGIAGALNSTNPLYAALVKKS